MGSLNAGGLQFHCVNSTAHGELDLEGALAHSCNGYFINAARVLGGQEILSMAYNLGFGSAQEFGRGLWTAAGELPTLQSLGNARALANFSFGQGELAATPCRCAPCSTPWPAAASTPPPSCLEGLVSQSGELRPLSSAAPQQAQVMQPSTARALQQALRTAAQEGTGQAAAPEGAAVGIKTGTAQTGVLGKRGGAAALLVQRHSLAGGRAPVVRHRAEGVLRQRPAAAAPGFPGGGPGAAGFGGGGRRKLGRMPSPLDRGAPGGYNKSTGENREMLCGEDAFSSPLQRAPGWCKGAGGGWAGRSGKAQAAKSGTAFPPLPGSERPLARARGEVGWYHGLFRPIGEEKPSFFGGVP